MDWCLLDLAASVSLLHYSVYKKLSWGIKSTNFTLLLADRFVKIHKEIVEDVILKVDEIYFPADFNVLDTEPMMNPSNHSSVILDRPFLVTDDVTIRCWNRVMTLSFGNITVELNIFHCSSQPPAMDDHEEMSMIDFWLITRLRSLVMMTPWKKIFGILDKILKLMSP